jgi:hypothetical protein
MREKTERKAMFDKNVPFKFTRIWSLCWVLMSTMALPLHAKNYDVVISDKQGNAINIGHAALSTQSVAFEKDESVFKDFFLSMKEMKCLEGPEIWCHIPYPYEKQGITEENKAQWLSHELLFMYKRPDQFGAQLWQGVYFDLTADENGYVGLAYGVDLNELASPPKDLSEPPLRLLDMEELEIDERWLPHLRLNAKN